MLPPPALKALPPMPHRVTVPIERLQHPLWIYDQLVEVRACLQQQRIAEMCEQLKLARLVRDWPDERKRSVVAE